MMIDPDDSVPVKAVLRAELKGRLAALPVGRFRTGGSLAAKRVLETGAWHGAETVLLYLSMDREASCDDLIRAALQEGKAVYVPLVQGGEISFYRAESLDGPWRRGPFGIREPYPDGGARFHVDQARLPLAVVVPGLAFDGAGGRLGRGKGYYDRFLTRLGRKAVTIGFCLQEQIVDRVPMGPEDVFLDALAHDGGLLSFSSGIGYF